MKPAARISDSISHGGSIISGSGNVMINSLPAAAVGISNAVCSIDGSTVVASGSGTVFINNQPAARISDSTACGATIVSGSGNVLIGG
ncbi:PAAR domain-containing protein [Pantoea sp. NPDC088449]|uniref:Zn-binding Pro-Ala-Ala-Arg (PAAR) domain-containing protein, incolved in TypeVI secretion n=1 Tax=Candidatus Pantoea floridensis TaxID=1938870 RepID=A0A286BQ82_9GAMM|nr:PAAR domain-containing protein [Pantoea floridensis]PIF22966.1 putative Zn-binding protein involved in type VI secretion [Enterobacteriaceae bacterium JKS000233]SOD36306.1 Zn-binding Pro-Ala-Ala-Arg (PAAR) domain-containing protein, incolved in TypeVI secretion [Pantoea floridensis]HBZ17297.1 hypothetical protein [Pantoea sp.]